MKRDMRVLWAIAAGVSGAAASMAQAQPYLINISGATAQQNFFRAPASTNDFLDVDADGLTAEQLAPFDVSPPYATGTPSSNHWWTIQYRVVGSGNGLLELVQWGQTFATNANDLPQVAADGAFNNRTQYLTGTGLTGPGNGANPGGAPNTSATSGTTDVLTSGGGIRVDIAPLDVPTVWFTRVTGASAAYTLKPNQPGYGTNTRMAVDKLGNPTTQHNMLDSLGNLNANTLTPDGNTVYDSRISLVPFAVITNLGTSKTQMSKTEARHLFATGRAITGENLVAVTRDVGSGTRNATMSSLGLSPDFGIGDNIGPLSNSSAQDILGPNWNPTNKGGSGRLEGTVINHRLAIGYTAAERGNGSWLTAGQAEIIAIQDDFNGGTDYVRPYINQVLDNGLRGEIDPSTGVAYATDGYRVGGPATWVTIGDPRNQNEIGGQAGNANPRMRNAQAAAYMNNATRSLEAFASAPGGDETLFSPGELLAFQNILVAASDRVQAGLDGTQWVLNGALNQNLQNYTRGASKLTHAAYQNFGSITLNGKVPNRTTGQTYTDGATGGNNFYNLQGGGTLTYGQNNTTRNRISGDFNNDGARNISDAAEMVAAWRDRNGGPAWNSPGASVEILGDFNGDGNFTAEDVRYWADGLAIAVSGPHAGKLDRAAGFTAVDAAFGGNFFGTSKSTGAAWHNGDSRADVAGHATRKPTPGFVPNASDGVIDINDYRYVKQQFGCNPNISDGEANWDNTAEAIYFDLSADINGDLKVNNDDLQAMLDILGTCASDFNLDGFVDFFDLDAYIAAFESGDCLADFNNDGFLDFFDIDAYVLAFETGC